MNPQQINSALAAARSHARFLQVSADKDAATAAKIKADAGGSSLHPCDMAKASNYEGAATAYRSGHKLMLQVVEFLEEGGAA